MWDGSHNKERKSSGHALKNACGFRATITIVITYMPNQILYEVQKPGKQHSA